MSRQRVGAAKPYRPRDVEGTIYRRWERAGVFRPPTKLRRGKKPFVIVIPPPNITGSLHMGHALNGTMQDVLVRHHRMRGDDTLWVPGTDHAGIATQTMVERALLKEGLSRSALGRAQFLARVWAWKRQYGGIITDQLRQLGCSADWSRERFTLDDRYARAVQEAFIHYARKGLIYRGERIINWCPRCASSISDLEVKHEERDGTLYFIRYPFRNESSSRAQRSNPREIAEPARPKPEGEGGSPATPRNDGIIVATARPETLLGDTAVAVHPGDPRYRDLVGKTVEVPLTGRNVLIVADTVVDREFGTGAVKVTPAHDHADADIGERQKLPAINVIGEDGRMTAAVPDRYRGLLVEEARSSVLADLRALGLLEREEPYRHAIGVCARCETAVEPLISKQWFVKMAPLAAPAIDVVAQGLIAFHPPRWKRAYLDWLRNVRDWCVSRQLWWGHRLPVWYCRTGEGAEDRGSGVGKTTERHPTPDTRHPHQRVVFSVAKPRACPECGGREFAQDPDVLDTWFSSALWPFAVFGWPAATTDLRRFFPTAVLMTAPDILHLWVARMVFSALEFMDGKQYLPAKQYGKRRRTQQVPFQNVVLHPTVLTLQGKRMSKSKGIVVDPLDLIGRHGADATRFGILLQLHEDRQALRFDENAVRTARNFVNKLWNIGRFLQGADARARGGDARRVPSSPRRPTPFDQWIRQRLSDTARQVTGALRAYRFGEAARLLHDVVWDDFADWYVEAAKVPGMTSRGFGRAAFADVLRLLHPFIPFVTEALWQKFGLKGLLAVSAWPESPKARARASGTSARAGVAAVQRVVRNIRSARALLGIPSVQRLRVRIRGGRIRPDLLPAVEFLAGVLVEAAGKGGEWIPLPVAGRGVAVDLEREHLRGLDLAARQAAIERGAAKLRARAVIQRRNLTVMEGRASSEARARAQAMLTELRRSLAAQETSLQALQELRRLGVG